MMQPTPSDAQDIIDCGNPWAIPALPLSGVYLAKLTTILVISRT